MRAVTVSAILIILVLALSTAFAGGHAAPARGSDGTDTGRYIVGFFGLPHERAEYAGERVEHVDDELMFFVVAPRNSDAFAQRAAHDPNVRYLEWDSTEWHLLLTPNDPLHTHAALWGTQRVGAEAAWDVSIGSTAVKIAVVDSGLNKGHEEFAAQARVLQGHDFLNRDSDPEDTSGCSYHGTHVSGTLGATINNAKGIAGLSQSSILPTKIFHPARGGCGTTTTTIVDALKYAGDQGAHISQNSWGGGGASTAINDAIAYAHGKGTTHVAAAGNSGPCTNCVSQPWRDNGDKTIVVTSLKDGDTFSTFSSRGSQVTVIAPGEYVGSSTSGTSSYHAYSGTSMAAPHVSGALALYIALHGNVGSATLRQALTSTAEDLGMAADQQGAGLVRIDAMLSAAAPVPPANVPPTASFTPACSGIDCSFTDTSTDSDGIIVAWSWTFGDGSTSTTRSPTHSYAADGTYTVTLTVTDDDGATNTTSQAVTVAAGGGEISLSVQGYKIKGVKHADLSWSGAASSQVDVYRDGTKIATVADTGTYTDNTGKKGGGSTTWRVCEAGTGTCSNDATWDW